MTDDGGDVWGEAESLRELRVLSVDWLRGEVPNFPGYGGQPASETHEIIDPLVELNESGLLTTSSQPARIGEGWRQRAYVEGFAAEIDARRIEIKALYSDLHILTFKSGTGGGYRTPVTVSEGEAMTWNGHADHSWVVKRFEDRCSEAALDDLRSAWFVIAIDLRWGRKGHLWDVLLDGNVPAEAVETVQRGS